jgi:hypothetical protein
MRNLYPETLVCPICKTTYQVDMGCPYQKVMAHIRLEEWTRQGKPGKKSWVDNNRRVFIG